MSFHQYFSLKSDREVVSCYHACSAYPVEEPIYVIKGSAGHKSAMSRTYTAL